MSMHVSSLLADFLEIEAIILLHIDEVQCRVRAFD